MTLLIAANWKMYKGPRETREFLDRFEPPDGVDVVVCPPYPSLRAAVESGWPVYAQNVHWEKEGLGGIACVGETEEQREAGETEDVLRRQVGVLPRHNGLVIAYEPVWAIGTGKTATPELAQEAHALIKSLLDVRVLYGGSVKPENAAELLSQPAVDGALVGGASLDVDSFTSICRAATP